MAKFATYQHIKSSNCIKLRLEISYHLSILNDGICDLNADTIEYKVMNTLFPSTLEFLQPFPKIIFFQLTLAYDQPNV